MPEFRLDYGTHEARKRFKELSEFYQGYITAMFWTNCQEGDDTGAATVAELSESAWRACVKDCEKFQSDNAALLETAHALDYSEEQAGHDYWLTRNGHGTGFWDRAILGQELGEALSDAAGRDTVDLYRGDDGLLYIMGRES